MRTHVLDARGEFIARRLATPLVLSSGTIDEITEAQASATVRVGGQAGMGGVEATGRGSIYLSDLWAWPDLSLSHDERDRELRGCCEAIARRLPELCGGEPAHPLELGLRLHRRVCEYDTIESASASSIASAAIPALARAMCVSPFDAALHDAVGLAVGRSAFSFYDEPAEILSADGMFAASGGACAAIRRMLRTAPQRDFPACVVVGKSDDLEKHLNEWVRRRGYRRVKLKLSGHDNSADVARTVEVFHVLRDCGVAEPWISIDTNEANPDAAGVLELSGSITRDRRSGVRCFAISGTTHGSRHSPPRLRLAAGGAPETSAARRRADEFRRAGRRAQTRLERLRAEDLQGAQFHARRERTLPATGPLIAHAKQVAAIKAERRLLRKMSSCNASRNMQQLHRDCGNLSVIIHRVRFVATGTKSAEQPSQVFDI